MFPGVPITTEREGTRTTTPIPEPESTTADITHPTRSTAKSLPIVLL